MGWRWCGDWGDIRVSDEPKVYRVKLSELIPDANNANLGSERGRYLLEESLQQFGAGRSVLLDRDGRIIAGNKTHEVAGETGFQNVIIVETSGDELVAVKRTDLDLEDDPRARQLAYADNRAGELSLEWNTEQLVSDLEAGFDLAAMFQDYELAEMIEQIEVEFPEYDESIADDVEFIKCPECGHEWPK